MELEKNILKSVNNTLLIPIQSTNTSGFQESSLEYNCVNPDVRSFQIYGD